MKKTPFMAQTFPPSTHPLPGVNLDEIPNAPGSRMIGCLLLLLALMSSNMLAEPLHVRIKLENHMPANGSLITPLWMGFHDGSFDLFDSNAAASMALERLAEDGNPSVISSEFMAGSTGRAQGVLDAIGPIPPGGSVHRDLFLDISQSTQRFVSFAAMVIPSNDAFIGNEDPMAHPLFDANGTFLGLDLWLTREQIYDAGTEVNDEISENTPALGQMAPDTGMPEGGLIRRHPGHLPTGAGGIVDTFPAADFTDLEGPLIHLTVTRVAPQPVDVSLRIVNRAPQDGVYFTPVWVGVHDGTITPFEVGQAAPEALERIAEDGNAAPLSAWFMQQAGAGMQQLVTSGQEPPVFSPGSMREVTLRLNAADPRHHFLSYAAMIIPSNDAFVASMAPIPLFDDAGELLSHTLVLDGGKVLDAGTEVNSEAPDETAFLAQSTPNTGTDEMGVVHVHTGFKRPGMGGILDMPMFTGADFTSAGYEVFGINLHPVLRITAVALMDDMLTLHWSGAAGPFEVQQKEHVWDTTWERVAAGVMESHWTLPADRMQSFIRVLATGMEGGSMSATYELVFEATWSRETHPNGFPANPHFSGLIGATHNADDQFWNPGSMASPGIESVAETGSKSPFDMEIMQAIDSGWADTFISGGGIPVAPGNVSVRFTAHASHSLLSLVSMIAPSPDWFVGVHDIQLRPDGTWLDDLILELPPYDAGTDAGETYTSPDAEPDTHLPISQLITAPVMHQGQVPSFGTFTLRRVE